MSRDYIQPLYPPAVLGVGQQVFRRMDRGFNVPLLLFENQFISAVYTFLVPVPSQSCFCLGTSD